MSNKIIHVENCNHIKACNHNKITELDTNQETRKKIEISGTNNRYMMKKAMKKEQISKKRMVSQNWNISNDFLKKEQQLELLNNIYLVNENLSTEKNIIISEIEKKIQSYKYQDVDKNIFIKDEFVSLNAVLQKIIESSLVCCYCKEDIFVLYEIVRETKQWTLDRIDNDLGHNEDNVVIACLSCNLQRRCQNKDKFSFTKQMKIHRDDYYIGL